MWNYEKRLQYPVKITQTNPKIAQIILSQFGGPDGELGASLRYFSQRYTMPYNEVIGTLTDIATEEFAHMEIVCAIVHQLTRNLTPEQLEKSGFDKYYVDHTLALFYKVCFHSSRATTFPTKWKIQFGKNSSAPESFFNFIERTPLLPWNIGHCNGKTA